MTKRSHEDSSRLDTTIPTVSAVRQVMLVGNVSRSLLYGVLIFCVTGMSYLGALAGVVFLPYWPLKLLMGLVAGLAVALFFVVGHDACHQSLTPRPRLNRILGRIAFLPSYHPYSAWEYTHNGLHHGYTNIKGLDPAFPPLTLEEYNALSGWRKVIERQTRTAPGVSLLYFWKIWIPHEMFPPHRNRVRERSNRTFQLDRASVSLFMVAQVALVWFVAQWTQQPIWPLAVGMIAIPAFVFFWLIGWAVHLHHTHPSVPWFRTREESTFFQAQVRGSVHAEFPRIIDIILHEIMDHTAHHADPRIPLYHLHEAQARLEDAFPQDIVQEPFTLRNWLNKFRVCRLYDYDAHRWLDWDGTPLTPSMLAPVKVDQLEEALAVQ